MTLLGTPEGTRLDLAKLDWTRLDWTELELS